MSDNLHTFLQSRRSIRRFLPDPIPADVLDRILTTATFAPSAHNFQPWRFVVLVTQESRSKLITNLGGKFRHDMTADGMPAMKIRARIERTSQRIREAPTIIVLCQDLTQVNPQVDKGRMLAELKMGAQSIAIAGLQILLAAHVEGIGGTWICWPIFAPEETRQALNLLQDWEPQGMVFLGYPAEKPAVPKRIPLENIVFYK